MLYNLHDAMAMNDLEHAGDAAMMHALQSDVRARPSAVPLPPAALPSPAAGMRYDTFGNTPYEAIDRVLNAYRASAAAAETPVIRTLDVLSSRCR